MKGMKPVKVYSCADRLQADMLTEALRREGIPAYAESKGSGDYLVMYDDMLLVLRSDMEMDDAQIQIVREKLGVI